MVLQKASMRTLSWQGARGEVSQLNPRIAQIIDRIDPGLEFPLYKAHYPFGSEVTRLSKLRLPNKAGDIVDIDNPDLSLALREQLGYNRNSNPVAMVLGNSFELFIQMDEYTLPFSGLITPGSVFGTWVMLNPGKSHHPSFIWNLTSGARSMFMLSKISQANGHDRVKRAYNLTVDKPKRFIDHWRIFGELASSKLFDEYWGADILFFSKAWFDHISDPAWSEFRNFLLEHAWTNSEFWRNQFMWDLVFSVIKKNGHLRLDPFVEDTVKHLIYMSVGAMPGLVPAVNDIAGPISKIQHIYADVYQLKEYTPIVMHPWYFDMRKPVYYSLQYPTAIEFSQKAKALSSKITDLYEIKTLLDRYLSVISTNSLNLDSTPIFDLSKTVDFSFYHTEVTQHVGIKHSSQIPIEDPNFFHANRITKGFPENSPFIRGCVRIASKMNGALPLPDKKS